MDHLVEIDNLTFRRADRVIYDGITLSIPKGKITAVMGPSGIGKTTLLRLIGGQLTPDEGDKDVFVHISALERSGIDDLADDQKVSFEISSGRDGRESADNIELK